MEKYKLFLKQQNNDWELTRFASDINTICCGVGNFPSFFNGKNTILFL